MSVCWRPPTLWAERKAISQRAGVAPSKVFPHNPRHLFARTFYRACRDMAQLADALGHSGIEATRICLASTGVEYVRRMNWLGLVSWWEYRKKISLLEKKIAGSLPEKPW